MIDIEITDNFDVKDVAKNIDDYLFNVDITVEELSNLVEELHPKDYKTLFYCNALFCTKGELPFELVEVLTSTDSSYQYQMLLTQTNLSTEVLEHFIQNHMDEFEVEDLLSQPNLTFDQFMRVLNSTPKIYASILGESIGQSRDVERAKYVVQNWNNIQCISGDLQDFRYNVFSSFGSVLVSDEDSMIIFGMLRPSLSSNDLREHEPCAPGWKRVIKWAGRNDKKYSWNEFLARHVLANQDSIDDAKSDLSWLSEVLSDTYDYFYAMYH